MYCLSQHQFSHPELVSSTPSSTSLQNNPSLPSLNHMSSSNPHSSSIPPQCNVKRSLNDFKQTNQLEKQNGLKKQKKDNVHLQLDSKESEVPVSVMSGVNERENLKDLQEKLHCKLKPELKKLCEILKLPGNVKGLADSYLEYVMNNHQVNRESKTSLQAFLISLCWIAASLLKYKLHHKESIALAKKHLKFRCRKREAEFAYSLLRCLRRAFLCFNSSKAASASQDFTAYHLQLLKSNPENPCVTIGGPTAGQEISDDKVHSQLGLAWKDVSNCIADVKKKIDKKRKELLKKQDEEMQKLNQQHKAEMSRLGQWKQTETVISCRVYGRCSDAANKREWLDKEYDKKLRDLEFQMEKECKNLEERHLVAQKKLQGREDNWVDEVKSWALPELINKPISRQIVDDHGNLKLSDVRNENQTAKSISDGQGPDEIPTVPHSNEDEGSTLPNPKQSFNSDHQNVYNVNGSSSKELNFDVPVTREVTEAVGSGDGLEITLNKPSLRGPSLKEPTIVKHDVGSTGCLENSGSSCSSPSGEAIPSIHGKSSPPAENIEATTHDYVSIVVEPDVVTHDIGQCPANETVHKDLQSGERLPEPTSCEVVESSKNGKHNGYVSAYRTLDNQNFHSSDTSSKVNNENREDSLDKHDPAAGRGEGSGNEVEQDLSNAPELVSASGKRAEDGSNGGERNVVCAVASHNFTGTAPLDAECASTATRLLGVAPQSGNQNASRQVEAANSHPQGDTDRVNSGTQTIEGHVTDNSDQSPAELVDNQVERSHQADALHTTCSFQQAVEILRPGTERHVSVTTATSIPPPVVHYLYQATPSVQVFPRLSQEPLEIELERITKERNQAILMHEQAKQQLNSECEKEIAEIRRKYDAKLQENESEFLLKKKELDANHQIVHMNNILAKTFRCKDAKNLIPPGTQPELSSSLPQHYMQQVAQLAAQNTAPRPPVVGRPPQLSLMSPGNLYIGSTYRAPMPHLLPPLRPLAQSVGVGVSYYTCPVPGQETCNIPLATSPLFSQLPSSSRPSINPSGFRNRAHQPEAAKDLPNISSLSLLDEWLMELDNQANRSGNPPSNCQQQMGVASNSYPLEPLQNIAQGDAVSAGDVVHLSDDD